MPPRFSLRLVLEGGALSVKATKNTAKKTNGIIRALSNGDRNSTKNSSLESHNSSLSLFQSNHHRSFKECLWPFRIRSPETSCNKGLQNWYFIVRLQTKGARPRAPENGGGKEFLQALGVEWCGRVELRALWITWIPPVNGWLKLNVNGASKGNLGRARVVWWKQGHVEVECRKQKLPRKRNDSDERNPENKESRKERITAEINKGKGLQKNHQIDKGKNIQQVEISDESRRVTQNLQGGGQDLVRPMQSIAKQKGVWIQQTHAKGSQQERNSEGEKYKVMGENDGTKISFENGNHSGKDFVVPEFLEVIPEVQADDTNVNIGDKTTGRAGQIEVCSKDGVSTPIAAAGESGSLAAGNLVRMPAAAAEELHQLQKDVSGNFTQDTPTDGSEHEEVEFKEDSQCGDKLEHPMTTAEIQCDLNMQSILSPQSTFLIDRNYVCLKGREFSKDDDNGLKSVREPPDKGFHSDGAYSANLVCVEVHYQSSDSGDSYEPPRRCSELITSGMITRSKSSKPSFQSLND
ncbi:unnamed protein product [Ilex paraguariensis]|uniref:Uncharacterized protein n=1 Tax=Ilex paraguariensis TaxID=185542 RepID=A0ABC8UUP6_9AQUA